MARTDIKQKYILLPKKRFYISGHYKVKSRRMHQIQAVRDIPRYGIKAGDLGGYVDSKYILSQEGDCWISQGTYAMQKGSHNTMLITKNAFIDGDYVINGSKITDNVIISGGKGSINDSEFYNQVKIEGNVDISFSTLRGFSSIKQQKIDVSDFMEKNMFPEDNKNSVILVSSEFENLKIVGSGAIIDIKSDALFELEGAFDFWRFSDDSLNNITLKNPFKSVGNTIIEKSAFYSNVLLSGNTLIEKSMVFSPIVTSGESIIKESYLGEGEFHMDGGKVENSNLKGIVSIADNAIVERSFLEGENHLKDNAMVVASQLKGKNILSGNTKVEEGITIENQVITEGIAKPENNHPSGPETDADLSIAVAPTQFSTPFTAVSPKKEHTYRKIIRIVETDYEKYTSDIVKLIKYPAMTDASIAETSELMVKLRAAQRVLEADDVDSLESAARELEEAFVKAENKAYRIAATFLGDKEKASLNRAGKALAIALDENANENERRAGYKSGMKSIEGILPISDKAVIALKEKIGLKEIEA